MQRVPSQRAWVFDEDATAEWIAQTQIWFPQRQPLQEPWFELALVIDASPSMLIWQRQVKELRRLLAQTGAFRDVRTWSLSMNPQGQLCLYPKLGMGSHQQPPRSPEELIDPNRRRLIVVVSDCISSLWQSGIVNPALNVWAENSPMALVQMLPEWLWDRTALSEVTKVRFYSLAPGIVNQRLSVIRRDRWRRTTTGEIKVPVLTLDPEITHLWSQMIAGKGNIRISGLLFSSVPQASFAVNGEQSENVSAEERVQRFRIFSSPMARRLAGLLAACPVVSLPIVRMIQDAMLPQSQHVHVAEVLLSGLFKLVTPIEVETNPDDIEYQFYEEGIRRILLESTPAPDTFTVLSQWIERRLGKSIEEFIGILRNPQADSESIRPFAGVAIDVLKRQGGRYARFAADLEPRLLNQVVTAVLPPLKTFEFQSATFTVETETEIDLQPFDFEVATIEFKETGWFRRKTELIIKQRQQQAWGFIEDLGNGVTLEMVAIPGGTFLMGSPETEQGHRDSESPQHQVTVQPFFIGKYPVTQAQWQAVATLPQITSKLNPHLSGFQGANRPVENVSWYEAVEFCGRLSQYTGLPYRLPSEAEWEYACRAGTTNPFHFGETITPELANYNGNYTYGNGVKGESPQQTTPVESFGVANNFGLYDMHGNVWEWCADSWHNNYSGAPEDGSAWLDDNNIYRLFRGGSWYDHPRRCRCAYRKYYSPGGWLYANIGFRVVCATVWTL
jgi:formylglycine-generating enzyme required for sulfatase activity